MDFSNSMNPYQKTLGPRPVHDPERSAEELYRLRQEYFDQRPWLRRLFEHLDGLEEISVLSPQIKEPD